MANVFTKVHHRARTTTLRDFSFQNIPGFSEGERTVLPRRPRVMSPTRRCNPHPCGLVSQSPYNKDLVVFDIWNPDFGKISSRWPDMYKHLERANFCSGPILPPCAEKKLPEIKYSLDSTSRGTFSWPRYPSGVRHVPNFTRFGHTPDTPARGAVPNLLPPIYPPPPKRNPESE